MMLLIHTHDAERARSHDNVDGDGQTLSRFGIPGGGNLVKRAEVLSSDWPESLILT